jgi:ATP-dependent DNA helicase RecQ
MTSSPSPPTALPADSTELHGALRRLFGFDAFRPGQEAVISSVMSGQDTLALMPTGAGKSLCYQLPAMLLPGITLVISPLIALMKDQYDNLPKPVYERSTFINSSLELGEVERRMADVLAGKVKLVYAAPERLRQQPFVHALARAGLALLVVDEAHCVSLWGHDFRPDYLFIGKALADLGQPLLLGMTATATPQVQQEIGAQLGRALHVVQTSPYRPNLFYQALHLKHQKEKIAALAQFCRQQRGSGIVYVRSRQQAETLAFTLARSGVKAAYYHAGLDAATRSATQEAWMLDKTRVIVATIAFGMGIDKANVRFIVHFSPPDSLESYAQESGRAGRDGRESVCLLLITPGDRANLTRWLRDESFDLPRLRAIYAAVQQQVRAVDRPTLVNFADLLRAAAERAGGELKDTELRVGVGLMERAGLLARHADAPSGVTVTIKGRMLTQADAEFDRFCAACEVAPGGRIEGALGDLADRLGWTPLELERRLLRWRDEDRVTLRSGGREPVIERRKAPTDAGQRMAALVTDYEKAQVARIDQLFAFTNGDECRHQALARHLGHTIPACGDHCDNCKTGAAQTATPRGPAERAATLEALLGRLRADRGALRGTPLSPRSALIIVDCVASLPYELTKTALAKVLTGRDGAAFSAAQVRGFGELQGPDRYDVPDQIDALVERGYLSADARGGQRLIGLGSEAAVDAAGSARPVRDPGSGQAERAYARYAAGAAEDWEPPTFEPPAAVDPALEMPANPAQVMIECVASLPFRMGRSGVAKTLTGSGASAVDADRCRHFGALAMCSQQSVADALARLTDLGYLEQELSNERPLLRVTPKAATQPPAPDLIHLEYKAGVGPDAQRRRAERDTWRRAAMDGAVTLAGEAPSVSGEAADRFERLRLWRRTTAQREGLPPFMIFHDRTLQAMAEATVRSESDLRAIRGVGSVALNKYGAELLAILTAEEPAVAPDTP